MPKKQNSVLHSSSSLSSIEVDGEAFQFLCQSQSFWQCFTQQTHVFSDSDAAHKADMFGARISCVRYSKRFLNYYYHRRRFCNSTDQINKQQHSHSSNNNSSNGEKNSRVSDVRNLEGYRDLHNLDFMKAAKILFSSPQKEKKFGLDFHLVQLFFALMPSLAVYLVAQYSRYEMRRMEAEVEVKKKADEEEKAKEMEAAAVEEKETQSTDPELLKVKERLEALEETLKEIVVETKKRPSEEKSKSADKHQERVDPSSRSKNNHTAATKQPPSEEATS